MENPCKDCLTFVMCKNRFEKQYIRNMSQFGKLYSVWFAFNDMIRAINCTEGKLFVDLVFNGAKGNELKLKHTLLVKEILEMFNLQDLYKERDR